MFCSRVFVEFGKVVSYSGTTRFVYTKIVRITYDCVELTIRGSKGGHPLCHVDKHSTSDDNSNNDDRNIRDPISIEDGNNDDASSTKPGLEAGETNWSNQAPNSETLTERSHGGSNIVEPLPNETNQPDIQNQPSTDDLDPTPSEVPERPSIDEVEPSTDNTRPSPGSNARSRPAHDGRGRHAPRPAPSNHRGRGQPSGA